MELSRRRFVSLCSGLAFGSAVAETVGGRSAPDYDLVVVGAGSGGIGAALAAARQGLSVLVIEKGEEIGGTAVRAGVSMWEPGVGGTGIPFDLYKRLKPVPNAVGVYSFGRHFSWDGPTSFPGGESVVDPARKYTDTLQRHGGSTEAFKREHCHGVVFEPETYAQVVREMLAQTERCKVLTQNTFREIRRDGQTVLGLVLTDGAEVSAKAFIDATGGGALCQACGCEMMQGQEARDRFGEPSAPEQSNDQLNGVTLIYRVTPVDEAAIAPLPPDVPEACWWQGRFPAMSATKYPNGDYNCNMLPTMNGRVFLSRVEAEGYPSVYEECRRRVLGHWHWVQTDFPEFRRYRISWIAPALGLRETSRVVGEYVLTEQDLAAGLPGQTHPDVVTIADHSMDRHGAQGGGEMKQPYGVPYRCLIAKGFSNLLVACRGSSFSSLAASSCRLSRTIMQLGQAAGTGVVLAHRLGVSPAEVPPDALRAALREQHCQLDWPLPLELKAYVEAE